MKALRSRFGSPFLARVAELVYSVLLRPPPLRRLAHSVLLRFVPEKLRIGGFELIPNPSDPVLSVAVTLGVYEPYELEIFEARCRPGATVLDVGANVGLYTGLAASRVGPSGTVVAVEPDPESYGYLRRMIEHNSFAHVRAFPVAAGDREGTVDLFPCRDNRADARLYDASGRREKVAVRMVRIDALLEQHGIRRVDLIKMDCQGAEGLAWRGLHATLQASPGVVIFTEFWPWGLRQAGVDPGEYLDGIRSGGFRAFRIDEVSRSLTEVAPLHDLLPEGHALPEYPSLKLQRSHANLLLTRSP